MRDIEQRLTRAGQAWRAEQPAAPAGTRPRRRNPVWIPAAAAVAVVAVALTAVLLGDRTRDGGFQPAQDTRPEGSWEAMPPSPLSARLNPVTQPWGDAVVIVGGRDDAPCPPTASCARTERETLRDGALYDVPSRTWTALPHAPLPLDATSSAVLDDVLYLWLVQPGSTTYEVLALDLVQRQWSRVPAPLPVLGGYQRLVAAGDRLVAHYVEVGRADALDQAYDPSTRTWEALPAAPHTPSYDRTMVWTGDALVLITPGAPGAPDDPGPRYLKAAVLRDGAWQALPEQEVVIGGWLDWSWTGERIVCATTQGADGGEVNGYGRRIPSGGYLEPATGRWSELPPPPERELPHQGGPLAAGGRWIANREGLVLDTERDRWLVLPRQPDAADQDEAAAWAAGRLVVWGGATGTRPADPYTSVLARPIATGAVWTPPAD